MTLEKYKAIWVDMRPLYRATINTVAAAYERFVEGYASPADSELLDKFNRDREAILKKHGVSLDTFDAACSQFGKEEF